MKGCWKRNGVGWLLLLGKGSMNLKQYETVLCNDRSNQLSLFISYHCQQPRQHATLMELNARGLESDAVSIGVLVNERSFLDKQYMQESSHQKWKVTLQCQIKQTNLPTYFPAQDLTLTCPNRQVRIDLASLFVESVMNLQASANICNITMRAMRCDEIW